MGGLPYLTGAVLTLEASGAQLIVGDGDGRAELEHRVPPEWRVWGVFTGRVAEHEVVDALNAMVIGFITQTLDALGITTKLPEYLATGLPVAMSPIPGHYDYVGSAGWSLPPHPLRLLPSTGRARPGLTPSPARRSNKGRMPFKAQPHRR